MFFAHPICEPSSIVLNPFLTSLTSALLLSPTFLSLLRHFLNRRRRLFPPLLLSTRLINLKNNSNPCDLRWTNIISLKSTSPSSKFRNLLLSSSVVPRGSHCARNLLLVKHCSNFPPHSMPLQAPQAPLPFNHKSRKNQCPRSVLLPDLIKRGMSPRGPLKTLWTSSPEDNLISPKAHTPLQNRRLLLIPLIPVRRPISPINPNNMEGLCLSPSRLSPHPALPRRSPRHSNRPHPVKVSAETTIHHLISTPQKGNERKKVHQSPAAVIGRPKKVFVGANQRVLSTSFPPSSFPLVGL
jgi:hypothetical protein